MWRNWKEKGCKPHKAPGLDCISSGHISVEHEQVGAFETEPGQIPRASWCLWCGSGVSNMKLEDDDYD